MIKHGQRKLRQVRRMLIGGMQAALQRRDIGIVRYGTLENLRSNERGRMDIGFLSRMFDPAVATANLDSLRNVLQYLPRSKSQFRQDIFVLLHLNFKHGGFFVEFGATDGIMLSNTFLLEKEFGWKGILAEPAKIWHHDLAANRSAQIETRCVWRDSDSLLSFNEVEVPGLSTLSTFTTSDLHEKSRTHANEYLVETISLLELLEKHHAPNVIDYLSIDTEGSEFDILEKFDFSKYTFRVITCEHNYTPMRERIFELLTKNGYSRVFEEISFNDDWYVST